MRSIVLRKVLLAGYLSAQPRTIAEMITMSGHTKAQVRYCLEMMVFSGLAHVGAWQAYVDDYGRHRFCAVFHGGPGMPMQPPRGSRQTLSSGAAVINRFSELTAAIFSWPRELQETAE